jgi:hypothetical protein
MDVRLKDKVLYWARFFSIAITFVVWTSSCTSNIQFHVNPALPRDQVARIWIGDHALRIMSCDGKRVIGSLTSLLVIPGEHILTGWVNDELNETYTDTFTLKFDTEASHNYSVRYKTRVSPGKYGIYIVDDTTGKPVTLIPNDSSGVVLAKLADIEKKLQKRPQNYDLWTQKGMLLRQLKRYEEALSAFDTATQMSTNPAVAWKQKSEVLVELRRYDDALTAITRAILAFPLKEEYYFAKKEIVKLQNGKSNEEELRAAYGEVLSINSSRLVIQHSTRPVVKAEYDSNGTDISTIKASDKVYIEYLDGKPRMLRVIQRQ